MSVVWSWFVPAVGCVVEPIPPHMEEAAADLVRWLHEPEEEEEVTRMT